MDDADERAREDEEWKELQREANAIDPERYRKRLRIMKAVAIGAVSAGAVWLGLTMTDSARNPCQRVRDHFCRTQNALQCQVYEGVLKESVEDSSSKMRSLIREQCVTKIRRLKEDEQIDVP